MLSIVQYGTVSYPLDNNNFNDRTIFFNSDCIEYPARKVVRNLYVRVQPKEKTISDRAVTITVTTIFRSSQRPCDAIQCVL